MHRKIIAVVFSAFICILFAGGSIAESRNVKDSTYGKGKEWSVRVGAIGMYAPEYEGSDDHEFRGFPLIDVVWRDTVFLNARKGLGAYLWNRDNIKLAISVSYAFGRDEDDSPDLEGLGDIDGGAAANLLFGWETADLSFDLRYVQQFSGSDTGYQVHAGLGYVLRPGKNTILRPSVRTTYAGSDHMEEYFSISQSQSIRSGLAVYDADEGFKSVGLHIISLYRLDGHWGVNAMAGYDRLLGDAADSPVVQDENQYLLGAGISYTF